MRIRFISMALALFGLGAPALGDADYSDRQKAVLDIITPEIQKQIPDDAGVKLAECVVELARGRELRKIARAGAMNPTAAGIVNKIMALPVTTTCYTEKLSQ